MRVLWISNAPWIPSGYGQQTAAMATRLQAAGHEVWVGCNHGLHGTDIVWGDLHCMGHGMTLWGTDALARWLAVAEPDVVVVLQDLRALVGFEDPWSEAVARSGARWLLWWPLDRRPASPADVAAARRIGFELVPMSRFGAEMMDTAGLAHHRVIWHGLDRSVWALPGDRADVDATRMELGIPADAHATLMLGMNKESDPTARKSWAQAFLGFAEHAAENLDAFAVVWSDPSALSGGLDLPGLAEACAIPEERFAFSPPFVHQLGARPEKLAAMVGATDVHLQPSVAEGFGVPLIEAAAAGVRTVANMGSAQPELIAELSLRAGFESGWILRQSVPVWHATAQNFGFVPHPSEIAACLADAHANPLGDAEREQLSSAAREAFDFDALLMLWLDVLSGAPVPCTLPEPAVRSGHARRKSVHGRRGSSRARRARKHPR